MAKYVADSIENIVRKGETAVSLFSIMLGYQTAFFQGSLKPGFDQ